MKYILTTTILLIASYNKISAQLLSPCQYFWHVVFAPAEQYLNSHTLKEKEIDTATLRSSLIAMTSGRISRRCTRAYDTVDLVINPVKLSRNKLNNKVAKGFKLLNIRLTQSISYEDLSVKYEEAKWLQALNKYKEAKTIFSFIASLPAADQHFTRFVYASKLRLAQLNYQKGKVTEALNLLDSVDNKALLDFPPYQHYDPNFDYPRIILGYDNNGPYYLDKLEGEEIIAPAKRLKKYILEQEK